MNKNQIVGSVFAVALSMMVTVGSISLSFADSGRSHSGKFEQHISGTYLVREGPEQAEIFLRLITLTEEGNWLSVDAQQENFGFTNQQGVWKQSEHREITANVIDFDISPGGLPTGVVRIRFVMAFSKDFQTVSGSFFGESFDLEDYQEVFNPKAVPRETFESTFQGRRITVDGDKGFKKFR